MVPEELRLSGSGQVGSSASGDLDAGISEDGTDCVGPIAPDRGRVGMESRGRVSE